MGEIETAKIWTHLHSVSIRLLKTYPETQYSLSPVLRADGSIKTFDGTVARKEEGYAFIKILDIGTEDIFASRADSSRFDWDRIRNTSRIQCNVAFSRKGARATKITLNQK